VRKRVTDIERISRALHRCPKCDMESVARKGTGIWECRKCGYKFAGGAYQPMTPTLKIAQRAIDRTVEEIRK
jgi:large subunit ribosomal protein L37Ae